MKKKIQGSQLINRLQNHALGKNKMSATQVKAADILLSKILSDAPKELSGPGGKDLFPFNSVKIELVGD